MRHKNRGFVLIEFVISMGIITILLIPIFKLTKTYYNLLNSKERVANFNTSELDSLETLGYTEVFTHHRDEIQIATINNLGILGETNMTPVIYLTAISKGKKLIKVMTELTEYNSCPW